MMPDKKYLQAREERKSKIEQNLQFFHSNVPSRMSQPYEAPFLVEGGIKEERKIGGVESHRSENNLNKNEPPNRIDDN